MPLTPSSLLEPLREEKPIAPAAPAPSPLTPQSLSDLASQPGSVSAPVDPERFEDKVATSSRTPLVPADQAARSLSLAKSAGVEPGVAERNSGQLSVDREAQRIQDLAKGRPGLAEFLSDPLNVNLSREEVARLAGMEDLFRGQKLPAFAEYAAPLLGTDKAELYRLRAEAMERGLEPPLAEQEAVLRLEAYRAGRADAVGGAIASVPKAIARTAARVVPFAASMGLDIVGGVAGGLEAAAGSMEMLTGAPQGGAFGRIRDDAFTAANWVRDNVLGSDLLSLPEEKRKPLIENPWLALDPEWLLQNTGDVAASIAAMVGFAAATGGGSEAAAFVGGAAEGSNLYNDLITQGVDNERALYASMAFGYVVSKLEKFGLEAILGKKLVASYTARLARSLVAGTAEGVSEYLEEPAQGFFGELAKSGDFFKALDAAITGLQNVDVIPGSIILGGAVSYSTKFKYEQQLAQAAQGNKSFFDALNEGVAGSKLRELAPERFQAYAQMLADRGTAPRDVYVPLAALETAIGNDAEFRAFVSAAGLEDQLETARATGGDLRIPMKEWATRIAGTETALKLEQDFRLDPEHMTAREAAQWVKDYAAVFDQDVEAAQAAAERVTAESDSAQQVQDTLRNGLQMIGLNADEADANAMLWAARATVAAKGFTDAGQATTPMQWLQSKGLQIRNAKTGASFDVNQLLGVQAQDAGGMTLQQQAAQVAGADLNDQAQVEEAARLWQEQGVESPYFKRWAGEDGFVEVYHGTKNKYDNPELSFSNEYNEAGTTFYVTESPLEARKYGGELKELYLKGKSLNEESPNKGVVKKIISKLKKRGYVVDDRLPLSASIVSTALQEINSQIAEDKTEGNNIINSVLSELGYTSRSYEESSGVISYAVWDLTNLKSVFNRGTFDAGDPRILMQGAQVAPGFFSPAARFVESINTAKPQPAKFWLDQMFDKKGQPKQGLRPEELDDLGLREWLEGLSAPVSKADVLAFIQAGGPQLEEVVKGDEGFNRERALDTLREDIASGGRGAQGNVEDAAGVPADTPLEDYTNEQLAAALNAESLAGEAGGTKFSQYVLPGGENYREVLVTLPTSRAITFEKYLGDYRKQFPNADVTDQEIRDIYDKGLNPPGKGPRQEPEFFTGSHWDEPNVLAHFRLNDRTDADGRRVLFIEEIQSDWHQKGRKEGYKAPNPELERLNGDRAKVSARLAEIRGLPAERYGAEEQRLWDEQVRLDREISAIGGYGGVPNAPFKKSWAMLAFKKVLQQAMAEGYDSVAWTPGEVQAERYDLSKQINMASAIANGDGTYNLIIEDKSGNEVDPYSRSGKKVTPAEMEDTIGKDLTAKLIAGADQSKGKPWPKNSPVNPAFFTLRGLDLKVGGEGMKAFYDRELVNDVNKYVRKLDKAAGVGTTTVETPETAGQNDRLQYEVYDPDGQVYDAFESLALAKQAAEDAGPGFTVKSPDTVIGREVWSLPITDRLREAVQAGQPLYQNPRSQGAQGLVQMNQGRNIVELLKSANASTFAHESFHIFEEDLRELASLPGASPRVRQDWETLQRFGDALKDDAELRKEYDSFQKAAMGGVEFGALTPAQKADALDRGRRERFARSFEAYLREGNAPTPELRTVFQRFKSWLTRIYRSLRGLDVEINDELRAVFNRMLASEDAIRQAQAELELGAQFKSAAEAGMNEQEFAAYQALAAQSQEQAKEQLLTKLMKDLKGRDDEWYKNERARIKAEVMEELKRSPAYRALFVLSKGYIPGEDQNAGIQLRLSIEALRTEFGWEAEKELPRTVPPIYAKDGVHPDVAAHHLGYGSGAELVAALRGLPPFGQAVQTLVDERMRSMDEVIADKDYQQEAQALLMDEKRLELLALEQDILGRKMRGEQAKADFATRARESAARAKAVREAAAQALGRMKVNDAIQLGKHLQAERKASAAALRAARAGDDAALAQAKQDQLIASALVSEARKARQEVDIARRYLDKFDSPGVRKNLATSYLDQIDALLGRFDLRKGTSLRDIAGRESLSTWLQEQRALGYDPAIPAKLEAQAGLISYKDIPLDDFRDLRDAVKSIEHLARLKQKLLKAQDKRSFDEVVQALADHTTERFGERLGPERLSREEAKKKSILAQVDADLTKVEFICLILDGKATGPWWEQIYKPINDGYNAKAARFLQIRDTLYGDTMFGAYTPQEMVRMRTKKIRVEEVGESFTKEELLAVALNRGNPYNWDALLTGESWTEAQAQAVLGKLDERDWNVVQAVWDHLDSYRPEIGALYKRLTGVEPEWVGAVPFIAPGGQALRGGYYPLKADRDLEIRAGQREEAKTVQEMFGGNAFAPRTRNGHIQERTNFGGQRVALSLDVLVRHLDQVTHDLYLREAVIDVDRLLQNDTVQGYITRAVGREQYDQLRPWLASVAGQQAYDYDGTQKIMRFIRKNATYAIMGLKTTVFASQYAGLLNSVPVIADQFGASKAAVQAELLNNLRKLVKGSGSELGQFVESKSLELKDRRHNFQMEVTDLSHNLGFGRYVGMYQEGLMYFTALADYHVSVATWATAYNMALRNGQTEKQAVDFADSAVRLSQGSGKTKDLSRMQRGDEWKKLWGMFMSYMNVNYNQNASAVKDLRVTGRKGRFLGRLAFYWLFPTLAAELLSGRGPDDDKAETWEGWAAKRLVMHPTGFFPGIRDIVRMAEDDYGRPVSLFGRLGSSLRKTYMEATDEDDDTSALIWDLVDTAGYFAPFPTGQARITIRQTIEYLNGERQDFSPLFYHKQ